MPPAYDTPALKAELPTQANRHVDGYLTKNRLFWKQHDDFDVFVDRYLEAEEKRDASPAHMAEFKKYDRAMELIAKARLDFIKILWGHQVFISVGVVDRVIFGLACDPANSDIATAFFDFVLARQLHSNPGFVLFPIHSFGIQAYGVSGLLGVSIPDVDLRDAGVILAAQTNNEKDTMAFLDRARQAFGIAQVIPANFAFGVGRHPLAWTTRNPLLVLKMHSTTSSYYENQFVVIVKLQLATALVQMLAVLGQTDRSDPEAFNLSTARTNNFQTLDIKHYLMFEAVSGEPELQFQRIPMNVSRAELTALTEMNVDIEPVAWSAPEKLPLLNRIREALSTLEKSYLAEWVLSDRRTRKAGIFRKLFLSVSYFHQSFRSVGHRDDAVVALAIAFETLLSDGYGRGGVKQRITRRVPLCLVSETDAAVMSVEVQRLMEYRGNVVHEGASEIDLDLGRARRAYVLCLLAVLDKISRLRAESAQPIGDLLGDQGEKPRSRWANAMRFLKRLFVRQ